MDNQCIVPEESEVLSEMTREMGWDILYDQLEPGRFDGLIEYAGSTDAQFFRERYYPSVCIHGSVPKGMATFIVQACPADSGVFCGQGLTPKTICALMPGDEGALTVPAGQPFLTCCLSADRLDHAMQSMYQLTLGEVLARTGAINASGEITEKLCAAIDAAFRVPDDQVLNHQAANGAIEQASLSAICHALTLEVPGCPFTLAARNHWRCVRMLCDFIEEHLEKPLHMNQLCLYVGVSARTLETAFREVTGSSPLQFIKARRLNVARHRLLEARSTGTSVKEAALRSGFWHLGHFSHSYLVQFGELPSDTLSRACAIRRTAGSRLKKGSVNNS